MNLTVDGLPVFAATGGRVARAPDPNVIFLHGAGMDHTVWTLQTRFFAHHGRNVFALDLPGHGRSAGEACESIEAYAAWILRAMDAAGLERAAIVGHSMGALIALAAAAVSPQRIWAVALLGAAPAMPVHPDLLREARAQDHNAIDLVASWGFGRRAHLGGAQAPGMWLLGQGVRLLERDQGRTLATDLAACAAYDGARDAAGRVRCPALVLAGAQDRMTPPRGAAELGALIEGARVVAIEGCGHMMMVERPDAVLDALTEIV
ncbi:MAG: alpha/beta hydrolase [Alphaproteobacteria bacterium]|nr:alpha/beta hydrolase [Alphaproteobacteria bacterium]